MKNNPVRFDIQKNFNGKTYKASYLILPGDMVEVRFGFRSKTSSIGGLSAEITAGIMLQEMLEEAKNRGEL
jgi:ribosomal 50S subunit-recycling heat shock protein